MERGPWEWGAIWDVLSLLELFIKYSQESDLSYPTWDKIVLLGQSIRRIMRNDKSLLFQVKGWQTTAWRLNLAHHLFVNKVLLRSSHTHLFTYHWWLPLHCNGRDHMAQKAEMFTLQPLQKKFADPCPKGWGWGREEGSQTTQGGAVGMQIGRPSKILWPFTRNLLIHRE